MSEMEWKDVSMEAKREYLLAGGERLTVVGPTRLHVAASGSHRVETEAGTLHYVAPGFLAITIENKPGHKGFAF